LSFLPLRSKERFTRSTPVERPVYECSVLWCAGRRLTGSVKRLSVRDRRVTSCREVLTNSGRSGPILQRARAQEVTVCCARYSEGDIPVHRLKARVKALCCENPNKKVTSVMECLGSSRWRVARSRRVSSTSF